MTESDALRAHPTTLVALVLFTLASLGLGALANWASRRQSGFLKSYFLGNRSMGAIAVALTAAVMSGGTFTGFPSFIYQFGWVAGLWIASYMVAPLTIMGILGKRIGQLARRTGAITLPDLLRERYESPALGLVTSLLILFYLSCNLVAQFKAGGVILNRVLPGALVEWAAAAGEIDPDRAGYLLGLAIFGATVVFYTTYGGFLAAIWTDVFQSIVMAIGVLILLPLALVAAGGLGQATERGMAVAGAGFAFGPGAGRAFHPLGLAVSYFFMWAITGMGQPSTMVRLMAFRDSRTLRDAIVYQTFYNALIYVPLIFIFVAARSIVPGLSSPDDAMPALVIKLANPYVAGLILAAPYGAVMSTVSGFLLIIASGLVRDLYQRFLRPAAGEREVAYASYAATIAVGLVVALLARRPPQYLQLVVVFSSTGMAAAFLAPGLLGCFWRRATAAGAIAATAAGTVVTLGLYALGSIGPDRLGLGSLIGPNPDIGASGGGFGPYYLGGVDPCVWALGASLAAGILVSLATRPPSRERVALLFDAPKGLPA